MKKIVAIFILMVGMLSLIYLGRFINNENISETFKKESATSGAYEALNFNGNRQTYPSGNIPKGAYYSAWEKLQNNSATTRDDNLPWESLGPHNRGGRTLTMAFNPQNSNTLYAGSASGGLWRSYTAGQGISAWERVYINFPVLGVSSIAFAPGDSMTMYIGTGEVYNFAEAGTGAAYRNTRGSWGIGILKTVDGGITWSKSLDWSYNENHGVWAIKIAPDNPQLIYAATTEGVYKSTNAGASWDQVLGVVMANDLLIKPSNPDHVIATCGNFASEGYGVYKTTDGGINWTKISSGIPLAYNGKGQLGMAPSNEDIIYLSIGNGFDSSSGASWLCRSEDFGTSWQIKNQTDYSQWQGWFAHDVAVSPEDPDYIVVIGIEVWVSENGGQDLVLESVGGVGYENPPIQGPDGNINYVHSDAHDVLFHPDIPDLVYVASDGGMHRSENAGLTWHSANGAYQTAQFYNGTSVSTIVGDFFIGGLQDNGTIQWNGDFTWTRKNGGDGSWTAVSYTNPNTYFVSSQRLNVRKTTNNNNFSTLNFGGAKQDPTCFIAPYVVAPSNDDIIYAGSALIGKSLDAGANWVAINNGLTLDGNPALSMEVSPENEDVLYVATAPNGGSRGHVFVTVDGNTFTDITGDLPDRYPMDMTVDPTNEATAYITFSGFGSGHVFKTTDYGGTWEDISGDLPDIPTNAIIVDPLISNNIYVGNDFGVFASVDGGVNWEPYQDGLPATVMVFDLKISPLNRKLRVATHGNGAYQRDLLEENVATENVAVDLDLKLYPNPSSGPVSLSFNNPKTQQLRIEMLDVNGRLLRLFANEVFSSGRQQIDLDATGFAKGIYFLRLSTKEKSVVQKILLQ